MKLSLKIPGICIIFIGTILTCGASTLLTFDGLPAGGPLDAYPPFVPNGYGGLNWNNFAVVNGLEFSPGTGYYAGVVSASNVAFNEYGFPASISVSGGLFNLDSAYLTFALNLDTLLNIEVQGFAGGTLLYDNTYTVNRSTPTVVNFNYLGVDTVTFISSPAQQFAMDNLTVTRVPEPACATLYSVGAALSAFGMLKKKLSHS
jgi:hypothetical protein